MIQLKPISRDATQAALDRVERYRLLNEPMEAESICLDVLDAEPDNQRALVLLLLSLTDQFPTNLGVTFPAANAVLEKLHNEYSRIYYRGVICERKAKTHLVRGGPGDGEAAWEWFHEAMKHYEQAERMRPAKNDETILRWNACARTLNRHPELEPAKERATEHMLE